MFGGHYNMKNWIKQLKHQEGGQLLCYRNISIKWLLMTFCCIPRSVPCSAIIKEASFCSRWELIQKPTLSNMQRGRLFGALCPKGDGFKENKVLQIQQNRCIYESTVTVKAQIQARQGPGAKRWAWRPSLTKKLSATDIHLQRKNWFSLMASTHPSG